MAVSYFAKDIKYIRRALKHSNLSVNQQAAEVIVILNNLANDLEQLPHDRRYLFMNQLYRVDSSFAEYLLRARSEYENEPRD